MRVFYDTGSVWDSGKTPEVKQSAGVGISTGLGLFRKDLFLLAFAFPIRQGRVEPVFIAGMNF
jgi:outer membrane protein assembly factor BamA